MIVSLICLRYFVLAISYSDSEEGVPVVAIVQVQGATSYTARKLET